MLLAETLIDKAVERCGSAAELARRMGIDRAEITKLRKGTRPLSPELAAEIADIAGQDAREAAIAAVIERSKGTRKEGAMREILGKALVAGVAGMSLISYSADSISRTATTGKSETTFNSRYIIFLAFLHSILATADASIRRKPQRLRPGQRRASFLGSCAYHHANFA